MSSTPINVDLSGKTAVVTGATGGIGKEIARGLMRLGATVIVCARSTAKGESTVAELIKERPASKVSTMTLDVASFASIRSFVSSFERKYDRLDILVNNAGAWFTERQESKDGYEATFAINVLGPHLVSSLLLPRLRVAAPGRIVHVVSSITGNYDAEDLEFKRRKYSGFAVYAQSKQALRMLTWGLAGRCKSNEVTVNCVAPGFVRTDFNQNAQGLLARVVDLSARFFAVSPAEGADTPLWAAAAPELSGITSKYFEKRKEKDGKFREAAAISDLERRCDQMIAARSA